MLSLIKQCVSLDKGSMRRTHKSLTCSTRKTPVTRKVVPATASEEIRIRFIEVTRKLYRAHFEHKLEVLLHFYHLIIEVQSKEYYNSGFDNLPEFFVNLIFFLRILYSVSQQVYLEIRILCTRKKNIRYCSK